MWSLPKQAGNMVYFLVQATLRSHLASESDLRDESVALGFCCVVVVAVAITHQQQGLTPLSRAQPQRKS
eukprot:6187373-Pleurochrysis_carterae.AAC.1